MTIDDTEIIPQPEINPEPEAPPEKPPVWSGWATFGLGVAVFFVYSMVQSVVAAGMVIWIYVTRYASSSGESFESIMATVMLVIEEHMGLIISVTTIVGMFVSVGMILLLVKARKGANIREYLALRPLSGRTVLMLLGVFVALLLFSELAASTVDQPGGSDFMFSSYDTSVWPALFWVALIIGAPIAEEVLFRGFLFEGFSRSKLGLTGAIVITSLVWAMLHVQYEWQLIFSIFVMGIVFGYVRYKTRSLWSTLLLHGLINLVATIQVAFGIEKLIG